MAGNGEAWAAVPPARAGAGRRIAIAALALTLAGSLAAPDAGASYRRQKSKPVEREAEAEPTRSPEGPLQLVVSIGSQRLFVYDKSGLVATSTVSTGVGGYPTPTGIFAVLDKEKQHYSNIYGGASMPFMQRLTMSGVALHSGMVTGRPASHGCIRLPHAFAIRLYQLTRLGVRVIIAPTETAPAEIQHARLPVRMPAPVQVAAGPVSEAGRNAAGVALDVDAGLRTSRIYSVTGERNAMLDKLPVSVFVSKLEGKVFVRHGFKPLFEAPAVIREPERLLGTHVFTAVDFKDVTGIDLRWQVVSVPPGSAASTASRKVSRASRSEPEPMLPLASGPPATAAEALDRIDIPPEALERISGMLTPGASLIISDHGFNREMRASGTDFIVLTR